jgi:hypothetical protein
LSALGIYRLAWSIGTTPAENIRRNARALDSLAIEMAGRLHEEHILEHFGSPPSEEMQQATGYMGRVAARAARGLMFAVVAFVLVIASPYHLYAPTLTVIVVGVLGMTATGAKVGQIALGSLLLLMILSPSVIAQIATVLK